MAVKDTLSLDDVGNMLRGVQVAPKAPRTPPTRSRPYKPVYDRCDRCRSMTPCLMTFLGNTDYEPELPLESPVRDTVRELRKTEGHRSILLCGRCISELRAAPLAPTTTPDRLPIEWN